MYQRFAAIAALALALVLPTAGAAQGLDTRAASQRYCLEEAERAGYHVLYLARPVPIMGHPPGHVWGERVRMQVASSGGNAWLRCTYEIGVMRAELRHY